MQNWIEISSGDFVECVNSNFKVIAGPGAGKTHWLITHIKNVLRNSDRINKVTKIACITYTTVASNEIKMRLQSSGDKVECSTIHSFLYNNLIKPYAYLYSSELNFQRIDGHEEHIPSFNIVKQWIEDYPEFTNQQKGYLKTILFSDTHRLLDLFLDLDWQFSNGNLILNLRNYYKAINIKFPTSKVICFKSYKQIYWKNGVLHHEDVLYFAYQILKSYPLLREFLSSKFPFIFLDEFQDTNPIQTKIITWLEASGSKIGVIGDIGQSIYKFQGAIPEQFKNFVSPDQQNFIIKGNRRSTQNIINFLNQIRKDFEQKKIRCDDFNYPIIVISGTNHKNNITQAINRIKKDVNRNDIEVRILARSNDLITQVKRELDHKPNDIWVEFYSADPSSGRERCLRNLFTGFQYAIQQRFDEAVIAVLKIFRQRKGEFRKPLQGTMESELRKKGISLELLEYFITYKNKILEKYLLNFYNEDFISILEKNEIKVNKITHPGKPKTFFENHTVKDLLHNLKIREDTDNITTIHNSKGAEFDAVGVCFEKENDIRYILEPYLDSDEESRIFYVAFSRAINYLILSFPSLSEKNKTRLKDLNLEVIQ